MDEVKRVRPYHGISIHIRQRENRAHSLPCEDTVRRWLLASQENSSRELNLLTP